ncbi:MAG: hypothetical protein ABSC30_15115 [Acidimicrobiales bacterium]
MNPGMEGRLAEDRMRELRGLASGRRRPPSTPARGRRPPRRGPIRPIGLVLVRVGRFLAGPEPEGRAVVFPGADWGRPY